MLETVPKGQGGAGGTQAFPAYPGG